MEIKSDEIFNPDTTRNDNRYYRLHTENKKDFCQKGF